VLLWGWMMVTLGGDRRGLPAAARCAHVPGTLVAVAAALLGPGPRHALLGIVVGSGYLWLFAWAWKTFLKREGMGGGDIKLAAMFGALLGPVGAFLTITLAAFGGALAGGLMMARGRGSMRTELAVWAFLGPASMAVFLWGDAMADAYVRLISR
jgi:leader peptidase (prepilin peptidase)/N-methyltransferase